MKTAFTFTFHMLHGATPTALQITLTYGVAALGAITALIILGTDTVGIIVALVCADWLGGVVSISSRSTRMFWASLPRIMVYVFCAVHLAMLPVIWWLVDGAAEFAFLWPILIAKVAVFLIGQAEHRT